MAKRANVKRGSDANLFSVNGAAEALSRTRRTITRALQGVKPDEIRSGLKLWRMQTIVDSINRNTMAPLLTGASMGGELAQLSAELEAADAELRAIATLAGRRAYAKATVLPLLFEVDTAMREAGRIGREDERLTMLRCDEYVRTFLIAGLGPDATNGCDWSPAEAWGFYNAACGFDADGERISAA